MLTGSKNTVRRLRFLRGAVLLATIGFVVAVLATAIVLGAILIAVALAMRPGRIGTKFTELFSKSAQVNWLSVARVFLSGARDLRFVVGIPICFYAVLSDGSEGATAQRSL